MQSILSTETKTT